MTMHPLLIWLCVDAHAQEQSRVDPSSVASGMDRPEGLRIYAEVVTPGYLIWAVGLNVEYRKGALAVSGGVGAGRYALYLGTSNTFSTQFQVHLLTGTRSSFEVALGVGPVYESLSDAILPYFPSVFVGYRYEGPRGFLFRVGPGVGLMSLGLRVSVGACLPTKALPAAPRPRGSTTRSPQGILSLRSDSTRPISPPAVRAVRRPGAPAPPASDPLGSP